MLKWFSGEHKYFFDTESFGTSKWGDYTDSLYVEVNERGQVVASGNPLWSKAPNERVHLIYLPLKYLLKYSRSVTANLSQKVNAVEISINIQLRAYFMGSEKDEGDVEFDPQELYDNIIRRGYKHLDDLIRESFLIAARSSNFVQQAFVNYAEHERPILFVEELSSAFHNLNFSGKLLKNMEKIEVQVDFNTVTATLKATF